MSETVVVDPHEEVPERVEFDLTPFIADAGPDWGQAVTEPYRAQGAIGETVIDSRTPNRQATIPLVVMERAGLSFDEVRSILQAKVALWQRQGGWIKRETSIGPVFARIETAALTLGGSTLQALGQVDADATLQLELSPEWLGEWVDDPAGDGITGEGEVVRVLEPAVGDAPSPIRIVVTDEDGQPRRGLIWGIRSQHYSADPTAALSLPASGLTPLDNANLGTGPGSVTDIEHGALGSDWTPVVSTDLDGVGPLTHTGTYRFLARCFSTSSSPPRVRLVWRSEAIVENDPAEFPTASVSGDWCVLDLGVVRIVETPSGAHFWRGVIQAAGPVGGENVGVGHVWMQPLDDCAGRISDVPGAGIGLQSFAARDAFNQSAGALTGKTADVGGTWAGAGDATDFAVEATGRTAQRSEVSDASLAAGRYAVSGASAMTATVVQVDFQYSGAGISGSWPNNAIFGVLARYVDADNWCGLFLGGGGALGACFAMRIAGGTVGRWTFRAPVSPAAGAWYTLRLAVGDDGYWSGWIVRQGASFGEPAGRGYAPRLATGGSHETGKPGIYEAYTLATALTRNYDNFGAWPLAQEDVIGANLSLELRTDGAFHDRGDTTFGPIPVSGDLPRLPAPGVEGAKSELLVVASRGDFDALPDLTRSDEITVRVEHRPSYLYVPDAGHGS